MDKATWSTIWQGGHAGTLLPRPAGKLYLTVSREMENPL